MKVISTKRGETWNITNYTIDVEKACLKDKYIENPSVVAVLSNPKRDDIIVVGYESGVINEWDVKEKKVLRSYLFDHKLLTMDWNAKGTKILAGYVNGEVAIWRHKKHSAKKIYFPSKSDEQPIKKIICTTIKGDKAYFILGGTNETNMITVDTGKDRTNIYLCRESQEIRDFLLIYKDPRSKRDPKYIISITQQGIIDIHTLSNNIVKYLDPPEIIYPNNNNLTILSYTYEIDKNFYEHLLLVNNSISEVDNNSPISGGEICKRIRNYIILVTLNSDGKVQIWNISSTSSVNLLHSISIPSQPSCITMCQYSRRIIVGCLNGDVFIFEFILSDVILDPENDNINLTDGKVKNEDKTSSIQSMNDLKSYKKTKSSSNLKQEIKVIQVSDVSNNNIIKSKSENVLTQDDKMINKTYINDDKKEMNDIELDQIDNNNEKREDSPNKKRERSKSIKQSGFVLSKYFTIDKSVSCITYENFYNLLSLGSSDGNVYVFDITEETPKPIYESKINSNKIMKLEFIETMNKEFKQFYLLAYTENGSIIPINLTEKKSMKEIKRRSKFIQSFITDFKGSTVMIRKRQWREDDSSYKHNIYEAPIKKNEKKQTLNDKKLEIRKKLLEKSQSLRNKDNNINKNEEELNIIGKQTWNIEKFLIFCTENELCIFTLPFFTLIQKIKFLKPIKFYGKAGKYILRDGEDIYESIIYTIDEEMNFHVLTLMDLKNISENPINLSDYGIKDISMNIDPIKISCLENGKIIFISERSETFLLNLFYDSKNIKDFLPKLITVDSSNLTTRRKSTFREVRSALGSKKELNLSKIFIENETKNEQNFIKGKDDSHDNKTTTDQKTNQNTNNINYKGNDDIKDILSDTKEMLNERGKKLEKLSEKTEALQSEAQTFAELARQLLEKSKR